VAGEGSQDNSGLPSGPELALLAGGLATAGLGVALVIDDVKDLGMFSTPKHPSPLHHWQYGIILFVVGISAAGIGAALLIRNMFQSGKQQ